MFDHKITTILDAFEDDLSETIKQSELPFLGHYPDVTYKTLKVLIVPKIRESKYPLQFFLQSLRKWPATFATYLDYYVADGYGSSGTIAVYPYIEKALHCSLSIQNKEDLWSGFRAACLCLGLSVSPRRSGSNYMVAEYLRQSGVPLNFLDELVSKMIKHADDVGLPDDNDPVAINHWRQGLLHQIRYLSKPVQKAIAADDDGYYVRLFVAAGAGQLQKCGKCSELEKRLIAALVSHAGDKKIRSKSMVIPKILFRDEQLGVELPQGESSQWRIEVDGKYEQYPGFLEARFIPLNAELPIKVDVVDLNGTAATSAELWEDQRNNRFLVFSENGAFVERGQLGQNEVIHLEPGEYDLLLRFEPTGFADELECLSDDPVLYVYRLSLDPAQTFELMRGPAKVKFRSDTKPALVWDAQKYRGIQGDELYASAGLSLDIKIPEELFFDETVKYILVLRYGTNEEPVEIPIKTDSGLARINIEEHCLGWLPGLARLLVELKREGFRRAESRSSIYLWNGLEQVTNRVLFQCSKLPACNNLLDSECDNVKVDPIGRIVTFKNPDQRLFRMVFQATEKHKQPFTWSVPGVFQQILKYHEHGMSEEPVKKGATLAITTRSRDVLEIFSTSNGSLQLGTFSKYVDFDRVGRTRIPLAGLVDYLRPGADTLLFCDCESQISDNLLRLVSPHHILDFNAELHGDKVILRFSTKDEMELISLNIRDMITGLKKELTISCNLTEVQGEEGFLLWLSSQHTSQNICEYELQFYLENWPDGAWIITFEGQIGKRWGRFSNTRNDHFAIGIPVVSNRIDRLARESWRYISVLSKEQGF
ncbi:MAG: hypothetical protein B6I36_06520 [Desulfobacteraceae bacterium 4572_35.1]|nr:MAG: hypothetical protein B6I36_06520 [Desulfobacteraceae bacterium 4572_35.1]